MSAQTTGNEAIIPDFLKSLNGADVRRLLREATCLQATEQ
jgi:hypothetical protein